MLIEVKLKNFRQHRDLTVNFENGMVALRGANEKGKTTLLEAIVYAMGGARTLREPLPEVVTWGEKETSLKVWLTFNLNGVGYHIVRSKSGAEIRSGEGFNEILATGQDEVTRYVETLLGCPIKTAQQLMLANQQKLRGTLEEDGAAVKLIEQLADFQLIDRIVALVQKHLPCGTTVSVESRVKTLEEQLAEPLVDETGPYVEQVAEAQKVLDVLGQSYRITKAAYDEAQEPAQQARQRIETAEARARAVEQARTQLESAKVTFEAIKPEPGPATEEIERLRRAVNDANLWSRAVAAHRVFLTVPEPQWEGTLEALEAERTKIGQEAAQHARSVSELRTKIAVAQGQRITQSACGLCGKDLANVPEVVKKNSELDMRIATLTGELNVLAQQQQDKDAEYAQYSAVVNAHNRAMALYQQFHEFASRDDSTIPCAFTWTGPDVSQPAPANPLSDLQAAERKVQQYQRELGRQQQAQTAVNVLTDALQKAKDEAADAAAAVGDAQDVLDKAAKLTADLYEVESQFRDAEQVLSAYQMDLQNAQNMHAMKLKMRKGVEDQLAAAKKELADMDFNNDLVNTLRKARPSIVEELWNLVAAGVSSSFSSIRGVPSTFVRDGDSFTVDGRGIKGLSGSTLDALGLAIRMILTKTFLPNTRFLVLDEPAAACDDGRETNMLGVIASSEFDQIIMVTHSDLADSFASQVIRL